MISSGVSEGRLSRSSVLGDGVDRRSPTAIARSTPALAAVETFVSSVGGATKARYSSQGSAPAWTWVVTFMPVTSFGFRAQRSLFETANAVRTGMGAAQWVAEGVVKALIKESEIRAADSPMP